MLMSYTLDAGKNRHNMDTLSEIHLQHKTISFKEIVGTGKKEINFSDVELKPATWNMRLKMQMLLIDYIKTSVRAYEV